MSLAFAYAFMAGNTFIVVWPDFDSRPGNRLVHVIAAFIVAVLWPLFLSARVLQKIYQR
jgi:hypothetical protein